MSDNSGITEAADILKQAENVVVFSGAGISAESGVPTFRGKDGMWRNYRAEELATPQAFKQDPKRVWEWYEWRRGIIHNAEPNFAHLTIAEMEDHYREFTVITQNVDGLHRRAGSRRIVKLHGNIWRARCEDEQISFDFFDVPLKSVPPRCRCGSILRPDVVWFGEPMPEKEVREAFELAARCEVMLVVGTSALVQPAANLPYAAKRNGAHIIELNLSNTPVSAISHVSLFGKVGVILPRLWAEVKKEK
ncbi:MAG: NAD-dependent deacylase [Thermoplasmata archaeon]|nr:MAG: NAD-dependent deacylase [Thermoplasmata archaeon]